MLIVVLFVQEGDPQISTSRLMVSVSRRLLLLVAACYVHGCSALSLLPASMPRVPAAAARAVSPTMLFGGGGKEGEGGGMNMMETIKKAQEVGVKVKELQ